MKPKQRRRAPIPPLLLSSVVFIGALYWIYQSCYLPYQCNIVKRATERSMLALQNFSSPMRRAMIARQNLERSLEWIARCPDDLDLYMIAAGSCRQLGRSAEAIPLYERALLLDRRPEIYLNLGQAQADANQMREAVPNLGAAVAFDPNLITEVPASLQEKVQQLAQSRSVR